MSMNRLDMDSKNINNRILIELDKIERFAPKYEAELRLLSKRIRRDFYKNNNGKVLRLLG